MSDKMTIAQALRRIKKLKGIIAESQHRATAGVSYDVTKVPAFRFEESFEAMKAAQTEMIELESKVAYANATNTVTDGDNSVWLVKSIRELQEMKGRIAFLKGLNLRSETVKDRQTEWDDTEMKHINRVSETTFVADLTEQARDAAVKKIQDEFEALNNLVEDMNHSILI